MNQIQSWIASLQDLVMISKVHRKLYLCISMTNKQSINEHFRPKSIRKTCFMMNWESLRLKGNTPALLWICKSKYGPFKKRLQSSNESFEGHLLYDILSFYFPIYSRNKNSISFYLEYCFTKTVKPKEVEKWKVSMNPFPKRKKREPKIEYCTKMTYNNFKELKKLA